MQIEADSGSDAGYQAGGLAWNPHRADVLELLKSARHRETRPIYSGSNHCFLVTLEHATEGQSLAVYKPARGEYPLYDFSTGTLYRREVGSWLVNDLLGWALVPPTIVVHGKYGVGSLQLFIESHDADELNIIELQRLAIFDVLLNNADRKSEHCLIGENGHLWAIDHGLTFHVQPKLRTVLWHFAGTPIPDPILVAINTLLHELRACAGDRARELRDLISAAEWRALLNRAERVSGIGVFPDPRYKPVPYRW